MIAVLATIWRSAKPRELKVLGTSILNPTVTGFSKDRVTVHKTGICMFLVFLLSAVIARLLEVEQTAD